MKTIMALLIFSVLNATAHLPTGKPDGALSRKEASVAKTVFYGSFDLNYYFSSNMPSYLDVKYHADQCANEIKPNIEYTAAKQYSIVHPAKTKDYTVITKFNEKTESKIYIHSCQVYFQTTSSSSYVRKTLITYFPEYKDCSKSLTNTDKWLKDSAATVLLMVNYDSRELSRKEIKALGYKPIELGDRKYECKIIIADTISTP